MSRTIPFLVNKRDTPMLLIIETDLMSSIKAPYQDQSCSSCLTILTTMSSSPSNITCCNPSSKQNLVFLHKTKHFASMSCEQKGCKELKQAITFPLLFLTIILNLTFFSILSIVTSQFALKKLLVGLLQLLSLLGLGTLQVTSLDLRKVSISTYAFCIKLLGLRKLLLKKSNPTKPNVSKSDGDSLQLKFSSLTVSKDKI